MSDASTADTTAVRGLGEPDPRGFRLLRDTGSRYADGAEAAVLSIIEQTSDVSSTSEQLLAAAKGWAQRYHLDPTRANIVRGLEWPADARVLEIGAGCGAVTRYLGERCAVVDALEPVPVRAAAAAARTHDLNAVQVFVGEIDDLPAEPTYDVVVVIGVLEYVGGGSADRAPYLTFLRKIFDRLVPGGTLVLAIENQLGVKYLAGSPEDHTNRTFDSLERYPHGGRARTFSKAQLEALFVDSGLLPHTRIAFPDYKLTRAVFGDFPEHARSLMYRVPRLPSPDWRARRPKGVAEGPLWRTLVEAGLETEFGNSFLVLGGKGEASSLWPAQQAAVFYSTVRRAKLAMKTTVYVDEAGEVRLNRTRVVGGDSVEGGSVEGGSVEGGMDDGVADDGGAQHTIESDTAYVPGTDLVDVVAERGADAAAPFLRQWRDLVDEGLASGTEGLLDLVPHNLILGDDGALHPIDIELVGFPLHRDQILRRGVFWFGNSVAQLAPPARWAPSTTIGELMTALGVHVGLPADGSWIEAAVAEEARVQAVVRSGPPRGSSRDEWTAKLEQHLRTIPTRRLKHLPLGERVWDESARLGAELTKTRAALTAARADTARAQQQLKTTRRSLTRLRASRAVRLSARARALARRALPVGSTRRRVARRLLSR